MKKKKRITRKEYYRRLDTYLSFINDHEGEFVNTYEVVKETGVGYDHDLSEKYFVRLKEDGYVEYPDPDVKIKMSGKIFLSDGGYRRLYYIEQWKKIRRWIEFILIIISGLGVIITIYFSYLNYSLTKDGYDERIQKIERELNSQSQK